MIPEGLFFVRSKDNTVMECYQDGEWIEYETLTPPFLSGRINLALFKFMLSMREWKMIDSKTIMN